VSTRPRPRPRRGRGWRRLLLLVPLGAAFVGGVGLGEALHDNPSGGGSQTIVRTLKPLTLTTSNR